MIQHKNFGRARRSETIGHDIAFVAYQWKRQRLTLQVLANVVACVVKITVDADKLHAAIPQLVGHLGKSHTVQLHERAFGAKEANDRHPAVRWRDINGFSVQCFQFERM